MLSFLSLQGSLGDGVGKAQTDRWDVSGRERSWEPRQRFCRHGVLESRSEPPESTDVRTDTGPSWNFPASPASWCPAFLLEEAVTCSHRKWTHKAGLPCLYLVIFTKSKSSMNEYFFSFLGDSKNKSLWATGGFWWLKLILQKESLLVKNTYGNVKRLVRIHLPPSKANCSGHPWVSMRRYFAPRVPCCSSHTFPRTCSFVPAEC